MATIAELVKKHSKIPGDIRVRFGLGVDIFWPYFQDNLGIWVGKNDLNQIKYVPGITDSRELYPEPKPKVKRAAYAIFRRGRSYPVQTMGMFKDDAEFLSKFNDLTDSNYYRIASTEVEFDQ